MADAFARLHEGRIRDVLVAHGSHPVPDAQSVEAAVRALARAADARRRGELLVVLLSGGASAMMAAPAAGLTLNDKIALTRYLLRSGLPIAAMNAIRKHVSAIKGGPAGRGGRAVDHPRHLRRARARTPRVSRTSADAGRVFRPRLLQDRRGDFHGDLAVRRRVGRLRDDHRLA